jgi:hypothetical protein
LDEVFGLSYVEDLLTEIQLQLKEKCENPNIGTFDYYEFLYILIKPILPSGFKGTHYINIESVIYSAYTALELHNKDWWAEKKLQIIGHLKRSKFQY